MFVTYIEAGWNSWRKVSGVICDRTVSAKVKGTVYRTVVRSAMMYGLEIINKEIPPLLSHQYHIVISIMPSGLQSRNV